MIPVPLVLDCAPFSLPLLWPLHSLQEALNGVKLLGVFALYFQHVRKVPYAKKSFADIKVGP